MSVLTVLLWNLAWRRTGTPAGDAARSILAASDADLICLTEASPDLLPLGHVVAAPAFAGPRRKPDDHKVLLWSRSPWREVDSTGHPDLPPARFVRATTETPLGAAEVTGLCIPWDGAHVTTGRGDRRRWQEHELYLEALAAIMSGRPARPRELLLGDFNQTVPRSRAPRNVHDRLMAVIGTRFVLATAGPQPAFPLPLIDHLAHSAEMSCVALTALPNATRDDKRISDHVGIRLELSTTATSARRGRDDRAPA